MADHLTASQAATLLARDIDLHGEPRTPPASEHERVVRCMRYHRDCWVVVQYHCNFSAFNGYHQTESSYSGIRCTECERYWRTNARYVEELERQS
jgi:hypothetical protein